MKKATRRVQLPFVATILGLVCLPWAAYGLGTCTGTGASVSISALTWSAGILEADGSWSVSGGADGVWLEYAVDGSPIQAENRSGTSGSWDMSDNYNTAGTHTFRAKACPTITNGGVTTVCLSHCSTAQTTFKTWPRVSVSCSQINSATLSCTGSLLAATQSPYTCHWKQGTGGWFSNPCWETSFVCKDFTLPYTVSFKVTDANGRESNVATGSCNLE